MSRQPISPRRAGPWPLALLALLLGVAAAAQQPQPVVQRYAMQLLGARIGTQTITREATTHEGEPATRITVESEVKLQAFGDVEQRTRTVHLTSPDGRPLRSETQIASAGRDTTITATFFPDRVECLNDTGGTRINKTVPIPAGITLSTDPSLGALERGEELEVGARITQHVFEPTTMTIQPFIGELLRRENLTVGGRETEALVLKLSSPLTGETLAWLTRDGELLQLQLPMGLAVVREDVLGDGPAYTPPADFAVATAIRTERPVENPREARFLRLRLEGVPDREHVLSDQRQRAVEVVETEGALAVTYEIEAADPPASGTLVSRDRDNPYLADGVYLNVTDAEIRRRAAAIAVGTLDRAVIAGRIRAWVHQRVNTVSNIAVPRNAAEVMESREGVCRDHAILTAALMRAAGIPTRVVAGLLYFENAFYYHAWVEAQIGPREDEWTAYDSTLPTDFVDATHLKFLQGEADVLFRAAPLIGQLKAEVLEVR